MSDVHAPRDPLTRAELAALRQLSTPTVANAMEFFEVQPRNTGFRDPRSPWSSWTSSTGRHRAPGVRASPLPTPGPYPLVSVSTATSGGQLKRAYGGTPPSPRLV